MSIRKEVEKILKDGTGTVQINEIATLSRATENYVGKIDILDLSFRYIGGVKGGKIYEIKARDYDGVVAEIEAATKDYMAKCADGLCAWLRNGCR